MPDGRCLQLFVREPVAGAVKTRLEARLGRERTLALYRRMLERHVTLANTCVDTDRQLWVAGDAGHPDFSAFDGERFQQPGGDIGARMAHALRSGLQGHDAVVLIGCDSPALDLQYLEQAFAALDAGHDAVLGPATDGGFLLIGLRRWASGLFSGIAWGTGQVLAQTCARLDAAGFKMAELEALDDIDEPADLDRLAELLSRVYGSF